MRKRTTPPSPPPRPRDADFGAEKPLRQDFLDDLVACVKDCHVAGLAPSVGRLAQRYGLPRDRVRLLLDEALQLARDAGRWP